MLGSVILEVAIGLVFIYLFFSVICSAVAESISSFLKMRAKNLEDGIRSILNDSGGDGLTKQFYEHPLIKGLTRDGRKPSYIPSNIFTLALMDIIAPSEPEKGSKTINDIRNAVIKLDKHEGLRKTILIFLDEAEQNINKTHQNIGKWYDESMNRVSGWYKRKSHQLILFTAAVIAILFNVDTIHIADTLYHDSALRSGLVAAAEEAAKQPIGQNPEGSKKIIKEINAELEKLRLPFGWSLEKRINLLNVVEEITIDKIPIWLTKIFGLAITAVALSLGAPFWFDILNKFINIRSAGKKPEKTEKVEMKEQS